MTESLVKQGLTCGAATQEGTPPPAVILHSQLEVGQRDCDEGRHNHKDYEDDAEDGVDRVHLHGRSQLAYWRMLLVRQSKVQQVATEDYTK